MKILSTSRTLALLLASLAFVLPSCTTGTGNGTDTTPPPAPESAEAEETTAAEEPTAKIPKRYRPKNGTWYGHWTPDRAHAEDHLRDHNSQTGSSGGVIEFE